MEQQFVDVYGLKMHYRSCGHGPVMLFLHGMPTSSYLWRKILPSLGSDYRCIAPDLMGMGRSDKPADIAYTIDDHIRYIHGFIEALGLKDITIVMHAWGSVIGFEYARQYASNVAGLVFYESHFKSAYRSEELSLPIAEFLSMIKTQDNIYQKVVDENFLVDNFIHAGMMNTLSPEELEEYTAPFIEKAHRKVLLQYVNELPFGKKANRVIDIVEGYTQFLQTSEIPKLLLYSIPGFSTSVSSIAWAQEHLRNITVRDIGTGLHFAQETNPEAFTKAISAWQKTVISST